MRQRMTRRSASAVVATAAVLVGILLFPDASAAKAGFTFTRLAGTDRYDTAAKVAKSSFGTSKNVVLASGTTYPDALAGGYLAGLVVAPILLTTRDGLPAPTSQALTHLAAETVLIVGGTAAGSAPRRQALQDPRPQNT